MSDAKNKLLGIGIILVLLVLSLIYAKKNYIVFVERHENQCLPYNVYYGKRQKTKQESFQRGDIVIADAGYINDLTRHYERIKQFPQGAYLAKLVMGVPGDEVEIQHDQVFVAGQQIGDTEYAVNRLGETTGFLDKKYTLGKNEYFLFGSEHNALDSRVFGAVNGKKIFQTIEPIF